ncbi:tetratricopeptide repeat protein [Xanthomarina spongicola]|uniref:Tetratricopeptide repeat protein n=1 Tax=Xanthomarina spongicola TaxID=570520 RepID=A0A316DW31_9FLAO|nr:tetratricopeptide repeat protein [Xanthomarina spongicola]PWK20793.1 tetratricopeptide repeat protein [Xanthomarina spongicola]
MRFLFLICFLFSFNVFSQEDLVASEYFKNGDFEKALLSYQTLHKKTPNNNTYLLQLVKSHQQLEQLDEAETLLLNQMSRINYPPLLIELGYNYQLKNELVNANKYYNDAIATLDENPNYVFIIGKTFEDRSLLEQAITAYEKAMLLKPDLNFNIQLARIYGEQGNVEKMFDSYLNFVELNNTYLNTIKRAFSDFISENSDNENNLILKRILLKKIQQEPNLLWNEMLSWLFVQQKDYKKAFAQEKAIFYRQPESLNRIEELAHIASNDSEYETAISIFSYITDIAQDIDTKLTATYYLIEIKTKIALESEYNEISKQYQDVFYTYGMFTQTFYIQKSYAHFLAFYKHNPTEAISFLKQTLELPLSSFQEAEAKLELGDILVLQEKFNEALIYYSQIQRNLKNSTISQEARFKVAKTSYYKGDFQWAESQLKILKSSTSQLIANDALELMLLITDNKFEDSTQAGLKLYAKADLMAFQNKTDEAILLLDQILKEHKGESIEDQALFKQANLFYKKQEYLKAQENYISIITNFSDDILADDAYFYLAELYFKKLDKPDKAKELYEKIVFEYEDSIYYVEARNNFRLLRGDSIN